MRIRTSEEIKSDHEKQRAALRDTMLSGLPPPEVHEAAKVVAAVATGSVAVRGRSAGCSHLSMVAEAGDVIVVDVHDDGDAVVLIRRGERREIHEMGKPQNKKDVARAGSDATP